MLSRSLADELERGTGVSVVIPVYNAARFLPEALQSVIAQTEPPKEILVIDDGSWDGSADIAAGFGPSVRVFRRENKGVSAARNFGIGQARSEWIAFLDADDVWEASKLEKQIGAIGPDVVAVHTNYYDFGARKGIRDISVVPERDRYSLAGIVKHYPFNSSSMLVRRDVSPRYPTWTGCAEDLIYGLELSRRGRIKLVPEALCGYRRHAASARGSNPRMDTSRFETVERWLTEQRGTLDSPTDSAVRQAALGRLVRSARVAKKVRHWAAFWAAYRFLQEHSEYHSDPAVQGLLHERIYPSIVYAAADLCRRAIGRPRTTIHSLAAERSGAASCGS